MMMVELRRKKGHRSHRLLHVCVRECVRVCCMPNEFTRGVRVMSLLHISSCLFVYIYIYVYGGAG